MEVKDMRLHTVVWDNLELVRILDQNNHRVGSILWCVGTRTKTQALALAKRMCERFNSGQEK